MKVTSWNVNSIRTRLTQVTDWLKTHPVDVLCLQETKVIDEDFPVQAFTDLGYNAYIYGQKSYNGVAMLSREPLREVQMGFGAVIDEHEVGDLDAQKRVISGVMGDVRIVNLYVPNGSSLTSDKFEYKLKWLALFEKNI